jgi:hypothetical protein
MKPNVLDGNVSGTALVYAGSCGNTGVGGVFITINDLVNAAVNDPTCGLCVRATRLRAIYAGQRKSAGRPRSIMPTTT